MVFREDDVLILNRCDFRRWLEWNHSSAKECYIVVNRSNKGDSLHYIDAVEEALCFGWIDSTVRKIDGLGTIQRFSPRHKDSHFTELNKARCERLERLGLMTESGRVALVHAPAFQMDRDIMEVLSDDPVVYENFMSFPELYRKIRIDNIQSCRKSYPDTFRKRLEKFVENTRNGVMYGKWNDDGRLP
jgi:uncharacterized protein YdeI (YjbR/CyaY-like superfamily)